MSEVRGDRRIPKSRSLDSAEKRFARDDTAWVGGAARSRSLGSAEKRFARDDTSVGGQGREKQVPRLR